MATTTPNFGWPVPTSSDLVKNGATAIEGLGDAIDASLLDLKGGTTGQVLAKASNTDMDFSWVVQDDANAIQNTQLTAKGALISAVSAGTPSTLTVGTNNQVLTADSSTATGLKWATPASSGGMTLLATTTLTGASVTVSSLSTYKELWFVIRGARVASNGYIEARFNADSGSKYTMGFIKNVNTTVSSGNSLASTTAFLGYIGDSATSTNLYSGIIRVSATDQTSGVSWTSNGGFNDGTGNTVTFVNGRYDNASVISSITIYAPSTTFSSGTLMTYGVN